MPKAAAPSSFFQVIALGSAQTIAWASSTYLPAVLGAPIAAEFGISAALVFAAYSFALVVMAMLGPAVGRAIDAGKGRGVLSLSNLVLAAGLGLLAFSSGVATLFAAWAIIGAGMALGLYDAAFAALVGLHGGNARKPITGISLLGGFASTVGWPLSSFLVAGWGWRTACLAWAVSHLLVALPLNRLAIPAVAGVLPAAYPPASPQLPEERPDSRRTFVLLAVFGAATAFVTSAMAAHLPGFLAALGIGAAAAIAASALVGPAQVVARVFELIAAGRFRLHPLATARAATALHPLGALVLLAVGVGPWAAGFFSLVHGAGNGLITIAKGTLPLALFGPRGYGALQGRLAVLQRSMQAAAPFVFALVLESWGGGAAIAMTTAMSGLALLALLAIRKAP